MKKHLQSQKYAWKGLYAIFHHERNFRIELLAAVLAVVISAWLQISSAELAIVSISIGFVLVMETINGVVEKIADLITLEHHKDIEYVKDAMAAAVLMSALTSVTVGVLIWLPYISEKF